MFSIRKSTIPFLSPSEPTQILCHPKTNWLQFSFPNYQQPCFEGPLVSLRNVKNEAMESFPTNKFPLTAKECTKKDLGLKKENLFYILVKV